MKIHSACLRLACAALSVTLPACFLSDQRDVNVLVVVVDSLRSDALSQSIGAASTPFLTALSEDGVAYRACYAHSSATLPAHAAILSARVPHSSRVRNDVQPIDSAVPLLQEILRERGWQTFGVVSTDGLVPPTLNQGIDRGCDSFRVLEDRPAGASQVNGQVLSFLDTVDAKKPWFAYVDYSDPASSTDARGQPVSARVLLDGAAIGTARTLDESTWSVEVALTPGRHRLEMRADSSFNLRRFEAVSERIRFAPAFEVGGLHTPLTRVVASIDNDQGEAVTVRFEARLRAVPSLAESRASYKAQVEAVDRAIGQLITVLRASGQYDRTIILVTGSHGEALGEHGITGHDMTLYDEVLRVPLLIKPVAGDDRRSELARRQFDLVRHVDVAPTLLDLLDAPELPGAEGFSLMKAGLRELVAESHPPEAQSTIVARRDDRYKVIYVASGDVFEMYDVKGDTLEMDNVFELHGHFRPRWQAELRAVARSAPLTVGARAGAREAVDAQAGTQATAAARK